MNAQTQNQTLPGIVSMAGPFKQTYTRSSTPTIISKSSKFTDLFDSLKKMLDFRGEQNQGQLSAAIPGILTPQEIQSFLEQTVALENHPQYCNITSRVASRLIQNAVNADHSEFRFNLRGMKPLNGFCYDLKPKANSPLPTIVVHGTLGESLFSYANGIFVIEEVVDAPFDFYPSQLKIKSVQINTKAYIRKQPDPLVVVKKLPADHTTSYHCWKESGKNLLYLQYHKFYSPTEERIIIINKYDLDGWDYWTSNGAKFLTPHRKLAATIDEDLRNFGERAFYMPPAKFNPLWKPAEQAFTYLEQILGGAKP